MSDRLTQSQDFEGGIAVAVAIVGHDARHNLVVTACNDHFFRITGGARADTRVFPVAFDTLFPDDGQLELRGKLQACFESGASHELVQAHDLPEGGRRWRLSLKPFRHASSGAAVSEILVTGIDVTAKLHLAHKLEVSTTRFRAVVDSAYDAIVTIDERRNITMFNRAAENLFGYTSAEVLGRPIETLLPEKFRARHPQHVRQFADSVQTNLRSMSPPRMDESNSVYGRHRDGTIIPVEISISKINVDGVTEFTAVIRDITDRARLIDLLKKQAVTDALTGLPNRREFLDFVDKVLGTDDIVSVFILDIDFFKKINDSHGHDVGDEVLRVLAKVGMSIPHQSKLFARWGGEEFVAALPGADAELARGISERLRQRVEQQDFEHAWRVEPIPFTVSIGVVTREAGERDVDALMRRADRALYRAKESGRNRVEAG
ncbi:sensor domain-containing diguanylate cyclase [Cupriavidus sp. 30B13]|uniref:sensor domain-containing diguanylate cyclase n=1 Tax=Cupriavidus sp. 30B13 TaxID=3384241 RepID=UPI003B903E67